MKKSTLFLLLFLLVAPALLSASRTGCYPVLDGVRKASDFFSAWKVKKWSGVVKVGFSEQEKRSCVTLRSDDSSWSFLRKVAPNLKKEPYLSWFWRVDAFPRKADGRKKHADDQAAQLYVVFPPKKNPWTMGLWGGWRYRIVGYTWETDGDKGTTYVSTKNALTKVFVLRSMKDGAGRWVHERRNVADDFKKVFGVKAPNPVAVIFQIDSDDTKSSARSAFSRILFESSHKGCKAPHS